MARLDGTAAKAEEAAAGGTAGGPAADPSIAVYDYKKAMAFWTDGPRQRSERTGKNSTSRFTRRKSSRRSLTPRSRQRTLDAPA